MRKLFIFLISFMLVFPVGAVTVTTEDWNKAGKSATDSINMVLDLDDFESYEFGFTSSTSISGDIVTEPEIVFTPVVAANGEVTISEQSVNAYWNVTGVNSFFLYLSLTGPLTNGSSEGNIPVTVSWGNGNSISSDSTEGRQIMARNLTEEPLHESGFVPLTLSVGSVDMTDVSYSGSYTTNMKLYVVMN